LIVETDDFTALVDFWGVRRRVRLDIVDEPVKVGDYVLNHVGFAIRRIPPEDVVGTLEMYEQLLKEANRNDLIASLARERNDLEPAAIERAPVIARALAALRREPGCGLARMSGSGATCFGLFVSSRTATAAARSITTARPGWWVRSTVVG